MRPGTGSLVLARGHEVSFALIERLRSYGQRVGVMEPFRVLVQVQLNAPRPPTLTPPGTPVQSPLTLPRPLAHAIALHGCLVQFEAQARPLGRDQAALLQRRHAL